MQKVRVAFVRKMHDLREEKRIKIPYHGLGYALFLDIGADDYVTVCRT